MKGFSDSDHWLQIAVRKKSCILELADVPVSLLTARIRFPKLVCVRKFGFFAPFRIAIYLKSHCLRLPGPLSRKKYG